MCARLYHYTFPRIYQGLGYSSTTTGVRVADYFQNGLYLPYPGVNYGGRTFSRWLWEWAVHVIGWTDVDKSGQWDVTEATGSDAASVASYTNRISIAAESYSFVADDAGGYLTLTGMTPAAYDGVYRINRIIDSKTAELDCHFSVNELGIPCNLTGISWRLWRPDNASVPLHDDWCVLGGTGTTGGGYTFHLHMRVRNAASSGDFPEFVISPYASWDDVSHTWSDSRYTTARGIDSNDYTPYYTNNCRVWCVGDTDRLMIMIRMEDDRYGWEFVYLGEIETFNPTEDPKPCIVAIGGNYASTTIGADSSAILGYGLDSDLAGGLRWLAEDEVTTVAGYLTLAQAPTSFNGNWLSGTYRRWNMFSRNRNLTELICECRTSGYHEMRGVLRRVWATGREATRLRIFGANSEFLHVMGGVSIPWNGSLVWYERG